VLWSTRPAVVATAGFVIPRALGRSFLMLAAVDAQRPSNVAALHFHSKVPAASANCRTG